MQSVICEWWRVHALKIKSCHVSPSFFFTRSIVSYSSDVNVSFMVFIISLVLQHVTPTMISFENGSDPHGIAPPTQRTCKLLWICPSRYRCYVFLHVDVAAQMESNHRTITRSAYPALSCQHRDRNDGDTTPIQLLVKRIGSLVPCAVVCRNK